MKHVELNKQNWVITCAGEVIDQTPGCAGVYRLYSDDNVLLYVGKSIEISKRLTTHLSDARHSDRQQRMMASVARVDCELTAGDIGAQLIENAAIKGERPLYNRAQRRGRSLWTQSLVSNRNGFLQIVPVDISPSGERRTPVFGLFRSRTQIKTSLRRLAQEEGLCLRVLGVESGRGACFQSQVGRCRGACAGKESPQAHNERLLAALERQRIAAWPFPGTVCLQELSADRRYAHQPEHQYHLLNHWSYLGSFLRRNEARRCARQAEPLTFDRDTYHIAYRALRTSGLTLLDPETFSPIANPFAQSRGGSETEPANVTVNAREDRRLNSPESATELGTP